MTLRLRLNENNRYIYFSGELVKGVCDVTLSSFDLQHHQQSSSWFRSHFPKRVRIFVRLSGAGYVRLNSSTKKVTTTSGSIRRLRATMANNSLKNNNDEVVIEANQTFLHLEEKFSFQPSSSSGSNNGSNGIIVSFPFMFHLPSELLPSFEHNNGNVRYWIEATAENLPGSGSKLVSKNSNQMNQPSAAAAAAGPRQIINIQVVQLFNPTSNPLFLAPVVKSERKRVGWCCSAGPFLIQAKLDRAAFYADSPISLSTRIENHDPRRQAIIFVRLKQQIIFRVAETAETFTNSWDLVRGGASTRHNGDEDDNNDMTSFIVEAGDVVKWTNVEFLLPPVTPPTINSSSIGNTTTTTASLFQVDYFVEVGVDVTWAGELALELPIVIGSSSSPSLLLPSAASSIVVTQQPAVMMLPATTTTTTTKTKNGVIVAQPSAPPLIMAPSSSNLFFNNVNNDYGNHNNDQQQFIIAPPPSYETAVYGCQDVNNNTHKRVLLGIEGEGTGLASAAANHSSSSSSASLVLNSSLKKKQ